MKPIRKQLCKECLAKFRIYENARRQKIRIKLKSEQENGFVEIKNSTK